MPEPPVPDDAAGPNRPRLVEVAASLARHLMRTARTLTGIAALAGTTLWGTLAWPASARPASLLGTGLLFLVLLAPAAVLGLFYAGLRDLARLPDRVSAGVSETMSASVESYRAAVQDTDSWWDWVRHLFGELWALRSLLSEHRALLVRYGMMLRVVTPGFLLLVAGAAGLTLLLVPTAALALLLVWAL